MDKLNIFFFFSLSNWTTFSTIFTIIFYDVQMMMMFFLREEAKWSKFLKINILLYFDMMNVIL